MELDELRARGIEELVTNVTLFWTYFGHIGHNTCSKERSWYEREGSESLGSSRDRVKRVLSEKV